MKEAALLDRKENNFAGDPRGVGAKHITLNENALSGQIEMLQMAALTLLKEVQAISTLDAADIVRGIKFYDEVERFERELIMRALELTGGHQVRAARLLGLKVTTLNSKVKRYRIPLPHDAPQATAQQQQAGPFPKSVD
ncbi:MAG TPA: helix-turn-helix domain-containing protein [Pyrinomonadaceae bacterium]|jgi:transcriptional regulator with GAF, ATPase, and Fis domain|nr:helix-turn-helix domain-containing protein [Pyrinomonadaceae bacterium]